MTNALDPGSGASFQQASAISFTGAGPRLGAEARRNIGARGALYCRGGYALLLGAHTASLSAFANFDPSNPNNSPSTITINESLTRVVSVADIEFGGSWRLRDSVVLSAGYMFMSWIDIAGTGGIVSLTDNANVLGFDGLVTRLAIQF